MMPWAPWTVLAYPFDVGVDVDGGQDDALLTTLTIIYTYPIAAVGR